MRQEQMSKTRQNYSPAQCGKQDIEQNTPSKPLMPEKVPSCELDKYEKEKENYQGKC